MTSDGFGSTKNVASGTYPKPLPKKNGLKDFLYFST